MSKTILLNQSDWHFTKENPGIPTAVMGEAIALPHTWNAVDGQDGGNDYYRGTCWYTLALAKPTIPAGGKAVLQLDGAAMTVAVYLNGEKLAEHKGGYSTFRVDLTDHLKEENLLAISVDNSDNDTVYPQKADFTFYGGIYRDVTLHIVPAEHFALPANGAPALKVTPIVTDLSAKTADVTVEAAVVGAQNVTFALEGQTLTAPVENGTATAVFTLDHAHLWDGIDDPFLYTVSAKLDNGEEASARFGCRKFEIDPQKGFFLNGKLTKFKGVCNHHDLGPLGGAVNDAAIRRQIRILKDMGCNAIRTSHNMPAPELVEACDEMGMMLMVESFDEWKSAKMANGYHKIFDEWVEKDLTNLIRHYRNNPSIVMWCIGNEVPDQWNGNNGPKLSRMLQDICHREDPTRPVTQGMDAPDAVVNNNMAAVMDVAGFNYRPHKYPENYKKLPQQIILGSETASTVSSRGVYKFPVVRQAMKKYDDHQSSSYDVEHCGWSNLPEDDWIWHEDNAWGIGEFVWTGFDYLGEPTPYYTDWPSHSSLFGIIDLAGLPKDRYYLYRSHWNKDEETLHILPHWTWPGREGEVTPIFVYTNYPSAEVFINGKSQGKRTKDLTVTAENSADSASIADFKRQKRYRLMWMDTKYEPGTVKVVAYNDKGEAVAEKEIHTAGKPDHIELVTDRNEIKADGKDLSFVTVRVVDKEGNLCPDAQHLIKYSVKGAGTYRAGANGDPTSLELFHVPQMKVFNGMMTAVVQSTDKPGEIILTATGKGLKSGRLVLMSK